MLKVIVPKRISAYMHIVLIIAVLIPASTLKAQQIDILLKGSTGP